MARGAFPLILQGIIDTLDLRRRIYAPTAAYGHLGRDSLAWEVVHGPPVQ